jgi:hypothetical protein
MSVAEWKRQCRMQKPAPDADVGGPVKVLY